MTLPPQPTTIANLPTGSSPLSGNEFVAISQSGETVKVTANQFSVVGPAGPTGATGATGATGPQGPAGGASNIATATTNDLAYYNSSTTLAGIATQANSVLVTNGSGAPSISSTLPNGVTATTQSAADSSTKVATTGFVNGTALTLTAGSTAVTQSASDSSTKVATTAFVNQGGLTLGTSTATTQSAGDSSTNVSTTAFASTSVSNSLIGESINGNLITSLTGTHTTASATITAGRCVDSTGVAVITGAGYSWAASNGNAINGTDASSSTLANSTTYHVFLCSGGSGTGTFVSASLTPTFPTGYATYYRRIGSFNTNGSGAPLPYTEIEISGGATVNYLTTQVFDINVSNQGSSARTLYTMSVPTGIKVNWLGRVGSNTSGEYIVTSPDETDVAPTASPNTNPGYDFNSNGEVMQPFVTTNTSGQIGIRAQTGSSNNMYGTTRGWIDWRRS